MSTTPLWLTLVVAALSPVSALFGVWLTQRRADRREDATLARELAREQARWQREDEALTFEHRRAAYAEFYESLRKMQLTAYEHGMGLTVWDTRELPEGWQTDTWEKLQHLELYATPRVSSLASESYSATWRWGHNTLFSQDDGRFYDQQDRADEAKAALLLAIRADLSVPENNDLAEITGGSRDAPTGTDEQDR